MEAIFWLAAIVVGYVYVGYPLLLAAWSRVATRPYPCTPVDDDRLPSVSVIVAARNEGRRLEARLENLLGQDYPQDRLQIIVVSDGSTDETAAVLRRYRGRVSSLFLPPVGKASALNLGAAAATNDILVFADARQRFATDALRHLVAPFEDGQVGGVSGELILDAEEEVADGGSAVAEGVGLYWRYEKWLRRRESDVGSMLGATGAIWAMRARLWQPLPPETLLDDVLSPMRVVLAGSRMVFTPLARAFDQASPDASTEERRKVRTLAGNYQLVWLAPALLVPWRNPVWLPFVSHKLGRLVVPYALVALYAASMVLAPRSPLYGAALVAQTVFYVLALHGATLVVDARKPEPGQTTPANRAAAVMPRPDARKKELVNAQAD